MCLKCSFPPSSSHALRPDAIGQCDSEPHLDPESRWVSARATYGPRKERSRVSSEPEKNRRKAPTLWDED
jgi:hypothetical protein